MQHIVCVLLFVDPPARGVARARADHGIPTRIVLAAKPDRARPVCRQEGIVLLRDLARQSGTNFEHVVRDWIAAVSASPHPRARQLLLGFVDPKVTDGIGDIALPDDSVHVLAEALANIARSDRDVAARVFALCATGPVEQARLILAKVCANLGTPEALYAGVGLIDDEGAPQIPYDLWQAAEGISFASPHR